MSPAFSPVFSCFSPGFLHRFFRRKNGEKEIICPLLLGEIGDENSLLQENYGEFSIAQREKEKNSVLFSREKGRMLLQIARHEDMR
ncbi:hypothetical protein [Methanoculleus sp.]|uniref:hypothetical protein n=1 Tax=Methanoculleus sp. TaxID=90427 RepID=UPI0025F289FE|nr:hypothetical protein [Methanoculleus sp.]